MKNVLKIALGVVTSLARFVEIGSLSTSAQAGAQFGYQRCRSRRSACSGYKIPWQALDLGDPLRPRLLRPVEELERL